MFKRVGCLLGVHDWNAEDYNKEVKENGHQIGEEIFVRCHTCKKVIVGIEKMHNGGIKWNAYDKEAILYDVNPDFARKEGQKYKLDKFREENK